VRSDWDRLDDILAAVEKIKERVAGGVEIHHLQVIGEAMRGISQSMKDRYPNVPWAQIIALRNILVHEYFGLDMHQVWMVTRKELPVLEVRLRLIHAQVTQE